jgi:signal peptidase
MLERFTAGLRIGVKVLLVISLALVAVVAVPGVAGGTESYVVLSKSMQPTLDPGDVVVVQSEPPSAIEEGDVVTYRTTDPAGDTGRDRLTHRVVEKRQTAGGVVYRTKGDANDRADPALVGHDQVVGEVWFHVPLVGHLVLFAQRPVGRALLLVGPGFLLFCGGLWRLAGAAAGDAAGE